MQVDGIHFNTILCLICEVGLDLEDKFPSDKQFASWLGLSSNQKITGGKVFSRKTQKNRNHLAYAFRQAANTIGNQKNTALSGFFRRIAFRRGRKVAITATARKLAVIVYNMITKNEQYKPQKLEQYQEKVRIHKIKHIQRTIARLNIDQSELVFK